MYSQLLWYLLQLTGVDLGVAACRLTQWTWVDKCWEHALDNLLLCLTHLRVLSGAPTACMSSLHLLRDGVCSL